MDAACYFPPPRQALSILHASETLVALDKPCGLLTVPGRGADKVDCLLARVQEKFPDALIVHRLDMATSGIVVMGRGTKAQRYLSILFQDGKVKKSYLALVDGQLSPNTEGEIDLPIIADWPNRPKQKIDLIGGKPSLTRYRVTSTDAASNVSRIELSPVTGRTHQLRVHMEAAGYPILGDALYGTEQSRAKANRLMLHAAFIELTDPDTGRVISVASKPPF